MSAFGTKRTSRFKAVKRSPDSGTGNALNLGCKGPVQWEHDHAYAIPNHIDRDTNRSGCGFSAKIRSRADLPDAGLPGRDSAQCQRDEQDARSKLEKDWSQYSAAQRNQCDGLVTTGGAPSYVELLTCLEMAKQAKELPEDSEMGNVGRR
jgi:hypothetical protein